MSDAETQAPSSEIGATRTLTPGGFRSPQLVHRLDAGHGLTKAGGKLSRLDLRTNQILENIPVLDGIKPGFGSGWITDSTLTKTTGQPFTFFSTVWTVPPAPKNQHGQTIFLFNSWMNASGTDILQPVLQWGNSRAISEDYWTVACWFIDTSGNAFYHDPIRVNVGDTLVGVLTQTGQSGSNFNYTCFFQGIDNTELVINNIPELVIATETLECYDIQSCADYPDTSFTAMSSIDLKTGGAGKGARSGSGLHGYWGGDGSQHVNFVDTAGHVRELYIHPGAPWVSNDITAFAGGSTAATSRQITGYWGADNSQHVNYVDMAGHVHELYIHPGAGWVDNDLIAWTKGVPAAPGSALAAYWGSDSSQHVFYLDGGGHVHELYVHPNAAWVDNDLTAWTNGAPAAAGSALAAYWGGDSSQHVFYIDGAGHVHELYIHPNAAWVDNDLTAWTKGVAAASGSPLAAYWESDSSQHVFYLDGAGHVHELYIHSNAAWVDNDLTAWTNGIAAAPGSALCAYWGSDGSQHVNYIDAGGHVHELYIHPDAAWVENDLTVMSRGASAVHGSALNGYWGADGSQHVNFLDANGHVHELYIHPGAAWVDNDLTVFGGNDTTLAWSIENRQTECGQHTVIVSNANPGGQVQLWYRSA